MTASHNYDMHLLRLCNIAIDAAIERLACPADLYISAFGCPIPGCGRLGDHISQAEASEAFGDHCDTAHPPQTPFDVVRQNVMLTEAGTDRWTSPSLSGHTYLVQRTRDGRYHVGAANGRRLLRYPLNSVEQAQLCIAQLARIVDGCHAEAARLQILRKERDAG